MEDTGFSRMPASRELDRHVAEKVMAADVESISIPSYSTDMSAAWLIVERMKKFGFEFKLHTYPHQEVYWVEFNSIIYGEYKGAGESAALAICRTALYSVGCYGTDSIPRLDFRKEWLERKKA